MLIGKAVEKLPGAVWYKCIVFDLHCLFPPISLTHTHSLFQYWQIRLCNFLFLISPNKTSWDLSIGLGKSIIVEHSIGLGKSIIVEHLRSFGIKRAKGYRRICLCSWCSSPINLIIIRHWFCFQCSWSSLRLRSKDFFRAWRRWTELILRIKRDSLIIFVGIRVKLRQIGRFRRW